MYRAVRFLLTRLLNLRKSITVGFVRLTEGRVVKRQVNGCQMCMDLRDLGLSHDLIAYGIREPLSTDFVVRFVEPGQIVADIGANIGYYALLEAKLVGEQGKVYAIEPVPHSFELLQKNVKLNSLSNVETLQLAIGARNGTESMYIAEKRNLSTLGREVIRANRSRVVDVVEVKMLTLDSLFEGKQYPDYVRMDVEGYEVEIIEGMKEMLASDKPVKMFLELHSFIIRERGVKMLNTLRQCGFRVSVAVWEPTLIRGLGLFSRAVDSVSARIREESYHQGYFYPSYEDVEKILMDREQGIIRVFFERN